MGHKPIYLSGLLSIISLAYAATPVALAENQAGMRPTAAPTSRASSAYPTASPSETPSTDPSENTGDDAVCSTYTTPQEQGQLIASATAACGADQSPIYGGVDYAGGSAFCFVCVSNAEIAAHAGTEPAPSGEQQGEYVASQPKVKICAQQKQKKTVPAYQDSSGKVVPATEKWITVYKWFTTAGGTPPAGWTLAKPANCEKEANNPVQGGLQKVGEGLKKAAPFIGGAAAGAAAAGALRGLFKK